MQSFSFIHTADLHLDSPFAGLRQVDGAVASLIKDATFRAFDNVVDLALAKKSISFLWPVTSTTRLIEVCALS